MDTVNQQLSSEFEKAYNESKDPELIEIKEHQKKIADTVELKTNRLGL